MILINRKMGFTLIELSVGIAIASIVFLGALNFITSTVSTDEYQKDMIILQNESKFALDYMTQDLLLAGFSITNESETLEKQPFNWGNTFDSQNGINDSMQVDYENFNNKRKIS